MEHTHTHTHTHTHKTKQPYTQAHLRILSNKTLKEVDVELAAPVRLIPVHINNKPPSYFIFAGLVFTAVTVPYLRRCVCGGGGRCWLCGLGMGGVGFVG